MTRTLARDILAFNLREICAERGLDASALARDLGWTPSKIETAMSGSSDLELDDLTQLALTLRVPAHILLTASSATTAHTMVAMSAG
ncbi:MAG: helix-turn-helix transcriptional regulator [Devosia sp.]|uniref:helix-turn-helix domain-containing protein n=1 Tax=unclassified Devosia TaxID=196773 RepID=UPI0019E8B5F2|nr:MULTISPECIES: helix-turn-helix transcriptional regulator [unclassified Devosia]MBF0680112.1 helix-turn-helix transcriptional regulator [Devosia sp.]WEJ32813.1 helix-turn-helix domain-containing protein [Devosia sp. SD17-2]